MTPLEYLDQVLITGSKIESLEYVRLGIIEESGEIAGKIKRLYRGDYTEEVFREQMAKELGDLNWYLTLYAHLNKKPISKYRPPRNTSLIDSIDKLEILKAHLTKAKNPLHKDRIINTMVGTVIDLSNNCGYTMEEILQININKIISRYNRGKIRGEGDER